MQWGGAEASSPICDAGATNTILRDEQAGVGKKNEAPGRQHQAGEMSRMDTRTERNVCEAEALIGTGNQAGISGL